MRRLLLWGLAALGCSLAAGAGAAPRESVKLPQPAFDGAVPVERALKQRRTVRSFKAAGLSLAQVSQVLWAADGVSGTKHGHQLRTAPSAGALYPLDLYVVVGEGKVRGLAAGVYLYQPEGHALRLLEPGDQRRALARAALGQMWMAQAPVNLVITGEYARCTRKYGERGELYTHIEAGCVGQNVFLQAVALGLAAGMVGAFDNAAVARTLNTPAEHIPLLVMPLGYQD